MKTSREEGVSLAHQVGMTEYDYNTFVVLSQDASFRVGIESGTMRWGDHVSIQTMSELHGHRVWHVAHFSPDQARLIAHMLLTKADQMEGR